MSESIAKAAGERQSLPESGETPAFPSAILNYRLEGIDEVNKRIPLTLLENIGVSPWAIERLQNDDSLLVGDFCDRILLHDDYITMRSVQHYLSVSVITRFENLVESLGDNARICILQRENGATLQEIGLALGISRERVRQIIVKTCRRLIDTAELVAGAFFSSQNGVFAYSDLQAAFAYEQTAQCCKLVLQESDYVSQFKFSDKFVETGVCPANFEDLLAECVCGNIGEGVNFDDSFVNIKSELERSDLGFFDAADIRNYLICKGYHFYGAYVAKGRQSYANVCCDAIRKYFPFDIKLDDDEDNPDMRRLREIVNRRYQGLSLPPANKAITSAITRDAARIVLSGRGRYCPLEKVRFNAVLFEDVYRFIHNKQQTTFYYSELFEHFKKRLLAETNISNYNFLHGMLKCVYPNEFVYERDMLIKNDSLRLDFNHRLSDLLKQQGRAMTKAEIRRAIRGINGFVITYAAIRLPEIIKWDYNEFNHIENINILPDDITSLKEIIDNQTGLHSGYCSDALLYSVARQSIPDFLERNGIRNARNLFYIASHFLGREYRFRKPHIVVADFPVRDLSVVNIAKALLKSDNALNYDAYHALAGRLGWAGGTLHAVFSELEKGYIRLSENDYVHKDCFSLSAASRAGLSEILAQEVKDAGFCALGSITDFAAFPECGYQWNGFLLGALINEYGLGFRVINPQTKDRRFQKGLIVPENSPCLSFGELIAGHLHKSGFRTMSEAELVQFLRECGIAANFVPQELYESAGIRYKNETFIING